MTNKKPDREVRPAKRSQASSISQTGSWAQSLLHICNAAIQNSRVHAKQLEIDVIDARNSTVRGLFEVIVTIPVSAVVHRSVEQIARDTLRLRSRLEIADEARNRFGQDICDEMARGLRASLDYAAKHPTAAATRQDSKGLPKFSGDSL